MRCCLLITMIFNFLCLPMQWVQQKYTCTLSYVKKHWMGNKGFKSSEGSKSEEHLISLLRQSKENNIDAQVPEQNKSNETMQYTYFLPEDLVNKLSELIDQMASENTNNESKKYVHGPTWGGGNYSPEMLLIPYTLGRIDFIRVMIGNSAEYNNLNTNLTPKPNFDGNAHLDIKDSVYLATQVWYHIKYNTVRVDWDRRRERWKKELSPTLNSIKELFYKCDFDMKLMQKSHPKSLAIFSGTGEENFRVFILRNFIADSAQLDSICQEGFLRSNMLYPDDNKIVCAISKSYKQDEDTYSKPYMLSLWNIEKENVHCTVNTICEDLFKKTVYMGVYKGSDTYLGLTIEGKLAIIWLDNDLQNKALSFKYNYIRRDSKFDDIAVDQEVKTPSGFRHRFVCLNKESEVFVCDYLEFKTPILLLAGTIKPRNTQDKPFRLLYDNHHYALIYCKSQEYKMTDVFVHPDNFEFLYTKTLLKYARNNCLQEHGLRIDMDAVNS